MPSLPHIELSPGHKPATLCSLCSFFSFSCDYLTGCIASLFLKKGKKEDEKKKKKKKNRNPFLFLNKSYLRVFGVYVLRLLPAFFSLGLKSEKKKSTDNKKAVKQKLALKKKATSKSRIVTAATA
eukprot:TRINITY_DN375_c0_g5_i2.p1 TRINITY_DN375_c0_g5~~TRINITY_DN375_c0_g5_i2.p1  ORF type:complete len:125 (+),score=17.45 TRINITY_DN375_c0_g5_i2:723-1097(+)